MSASKILQFLLMVLMGSFLPRSQGNAGQGLPFDPHVPGLEVTRIITGREAMNDIHKLHGMTIDILQGVIVTYGKERLKKSEVWASEAGSPEKAQDQLDIMIQKMKESKRSPFHSYRSWKQNGLQVTGFKGMGQMHCVFRVLAWAYWISGPEKQMGMIIDHIAASHTSFPKDTVRP